MQSRFSAFNPMGVISFETRGTTPNAQMKPRERDVESEGKENQDESRGMVAEQDDNDNGCPQRSLPLSSSIIICPRLESMVPGLNKGEDHGSTGAVNCSEPASPNSDCGPVSGLNRAIWLQRPTTNLTRLKVYNYQRQPKIGRNGTCN